MFFAVSLFVYYMFAIYSYNPCSGRFQSDPPMVSSGDEPHYLIMISSLLVDRDLNLGNNYASARLGGFDAGLRYQRQNLDHHTVVIDRRSGGVVLWANIFGLDGSPCDPKDLTCVGYQRVSDLFPDYAPNNSNFIERPWHSVPFPALLALLISGSRPEAFEANAIYVVLFISWLAGLLTYFCARKVGLEEKWSLGAVAVLYFASPWLVYSHALFAMTFLGLLMVAALSAFIYKRFAIAAVLVTITSLQSEAFIAILPTWTLYLFFAKQRKNAWRFAAAGLGAVIIAAMINRVLLGKVSLRGMWFVFAPVLWKTFIEPERGLFLFVPWSVVALVFLGAVLVKRGGGTDPHVLMMAAGLLPMAAIYVFMPDTGGAGYGPRYWVPFMPWLAILFAIATKKSWNLKPLLTRPILVVLIGISAVIAVTAGVANYSTVLFWIKPPWHTAKVMLLRADPNVQNVLCPARKTDFWIGSGCGEAATTGATVLPPQPVRANALVIVSRLACATPIVEGAEVLRVRALDSDGQTQALSMVAGRDTSEWSYDCKTTNMTVKHRRAQVFSSYSAGLDNQPCEGHRYVATLRFNKLVNVKEMQFEWVGGQAAIILDKVTLTDETTGNSYWLEPALFKSVAR